MARLGKYLSLCLGIIIVVSSLLVIESSNAQTTAPAPPVPEFTLKYEANPYDIPPSFTIDPYTGDNVTTYAGGHNENQTIIVTIDRVKVDTQAISQYLNGSDFFLSYNIRAKGHFLDNGWKELSDLSYSKLTDPSHEVYVIYIDYPPNAALDFQVKASIRHNTWVYVPDHPFLPPISGDYQQTTIIDSTSGWSNMQTITIPENTTSPSVTVPEIPTLAILPLLVAVPLIIVYYRKGKTQGLQPTKK